jgi:drug/metabolite transporter (DMT)-like permease
MIFDTESTGIEGEVKKFEKPLFQTLGMFVGMCSALFMHFAVLYFKIPFPGYKHASSKVQDGRGGSAESPMDVIPLWMYFLLIIPALFDLAATALCMMGLMHLEVSIYQMLRGSAIVFVAILKHFALGDKLKGYMWVGVFWNVVSIVLVGATAIFSSSGEEDDGSGKDPLKGVMLILLGAFVQSLQYAFEEKVMSMDVSAPPLLLIGMEGFWGTIVCAFVLFPLCYALPGNDAGGSMEDPYDTLAMLQNNTDLQFVFFLYFLSIFAYNMLAVLVTFMLNSVWHAILDNFRPITVWITDLFIFYYITTSFGESWTVWSWMQLGGLFVLLYGTAVYNAPNAGSIKLTGGPLSCFLNFDYAENDEETQPLVAGKTADKPEGYLSPYQSPFLTPRSRAERKAKRAEANSYV